MGRLCQELLQRFILQILLATLVLQWFVVDYGVETNSSVFTVPNRCTWNVGTSLTNAGGAGTWPVLELDALNGKDVLYMDGTDDYLRCANLPSGTNYELFAVLRVTNHNDLVKYMWSGSGSSARRMFYRDLNRWYFASSSSSAGGHIDGLTNQWAIFDVAYGTGAAILTNNVAYVSATLGEQTPTEMYYGTRYGLTLFGKFQLAELLVYATNFNSGTATRTEIYNYLKNKYAL